MTQMNPDPSLTGVAQRLDALDAELALATRRSRGRNTSLGVLMVLTIIFLFFYLGYAYHRYANEVTPDLVVANAQVSFEDSLPSARLQLEANLKANAPKYVNNAIDQLQGMPDTYASKLQDDANSAMDKAMPQISDELYQSLKSTLDQAKQSGTGTDEQKFQSTLAALGQVYADETTKLVNQAHATYASEAVEFTDYLERLGKNQDLDQRDQMHRELFRNVLMLIRERANSAPGSQLDTSNLAGQGK